MVWAGEERKAPGECLGIRTAGSEAWETVQCGTGKCGVGEI